MQEFSQPSELPSITCDLPSIPLGELPPEYPIQEISEQAVPDVLSTAAKPSVYPQRIFVMRAENLDPDLVAEAYSQYLDDKIQSMSFPHEQPASETEQTCIRQAHAGLVAVGDELGVDVRDRLPGQNRYHFFDSHEAYLEDARAVIDEELVGLGTGMCTTETGVLWTRGGHDPRQGITHETSHLVASQQIYVTKGSEEVNGTDTETIHTQEAGGYFDVAKQGFNELVTEMLAYRALTDIDDPTYTSYPVEAQLGDAVVRETAAYHGIEPREVESLLIRGMLTGDREGVVLIDQALGIDRSDALFGMPGHLTAEEGLDLADTLGLPQAAENIKAWQAGKRPSFFKW